MDVSEAFMQESLSDLETAKILYDRGKYSHAIYHMQQCFEKSLKAIYCYSKVKFDNKTEKEAYDEAVKYSHNTKESTLDLLMNISSVEEKFLLSHLPEDSSKDPRYQHLITQLKQVIKGFRDKVKDVANKNEPSIEIIVNTFPKFVDEKYQKYESNIRLIKKLVPQTISSTGVSIQDLSPLSYSFLDFVNSSCLLYPCLSRMEAISRYPDYNFRSENTSILNEDEVQGACDKILKMLNSFVEISSMTVKV
jgi:HEPN domain-containing protein